ncbi:MAG: hypothetical protein WAS56_06225 [Saprospiraceae bacterium]|nr:hypothetical protein [Saprospiraceae bacterium]
MRLQPSTNYGIQKHFRTLKNILITSKYLPVYNSISVKQNEKNTAKVYSAFTEQLLEINNNNFVIVAAVKKLFYHL